MQRKKIMVDLSTGEPPELLGSVLEKQQARRDANYA
jgi:hypothetical protein